MDRGFPGSDLFAVQFAVSITLSLLFLWLVRVALRSKAPAKWIIGLSFVALVIFSFVQPAFDDTAMAVCALQVLVTLPVVLVCRMVPEFRPAAFVCAMLAMVGCYAYSFVDPFQRLAVFKQLQREYPLVSVADRLRYEDSRTAVANSNPSVAAVAQPLKEPIEKRLARQENRHGRGARDLFLYQLHHETERRFAWQQGFGYRRIIPLSRAHLETEDPPPIPMSPPAAPESTPPDSASALLGSRQTSAVTPENSDLLQDLHQAGLSDFLNQSRIGYVVDRDHVAGFLPHRFAEIPPARDLQQPLRWRVSRLELISLLKHAEPVAYVTEHLPQMDELQQAPTRALTEFERDSLKQLRSDEDLVVQTHPQLIRMVGSVRAGNDCLKCHSVKRGELLGAFSYELVPIKEDMPKTD